VLLGADRVSHTVIYQPRELLHRGSVRAVKTDAFALYRDCAPKLAIEELRVALYAKSACYGLDDVLNGLGVVQLVDDFALLRMWLAVRRHRLGCVCPLHACDSTVTAGAQGRYQSGHQPVAGLRML
jgi:hypothetical protein